MIKREQDMIDRLLALAEACDLELYVEARKVFPAITNDFDHAWKLYEHHGNKVQALKAWRKLSEEQRTACIASIPDWVAATNKDMSFPSRRHFATFLNQEGWNDELPKGKKANIAPAPTSKSFSEKV